MKLAELAAPRLGGPAVLPRQSGRNTLLPRWGVLALASSAARKVTGPATARTRAGAAAMFQAARAMALARVMAAAVAMVGAAEVMEAAPVVVEVGGGPATSAGVRTTGPVTALRMPVVAAAMGAVPAVAAAMVVAGAVATVVAVEAVLVRPTKVAVGAAAVVGPASSAAVLTTGPETALRSPAGSDASLPTEHAIAL